MWGNLGHGASCGRTVLTNSLPPSNSPFFLSPLSTLNGFLDKQFGGKAKVNII